MKRTIMLGFILMISQYQVFSESLVIPDYSPKLRCQFGYHVYCGCRDVGFVYGYGDTCEAAREDAKSNLSRIRLC